MAKGFSVDEKFAAAPAEVWAYLTDFGRAGNWMPGIDAMTQASEGPLEAGARFSFVSRGKTRETRVTALDPGRRIALTSTQGGVTATYTYSLVPHGDGTEVTLHAACEATGLWKLLHPMINVMMKRSDSCQLAKLRAAMEGQGTATRVH